MFTVEPPPPPPPPAGGAGGVGAAGAALGVLLLPPPPRARAATARLAPPPTAPAPLLRDNISLDTRTPPASSAAFASRFGSVRASSRALAGPTTRGGK